MDALEAAGFPLISEQRNGTVFWRFMDCFCAEQMVALTGDELMALYFSRGLLQPLLGTPVHEAIDTALSKIGAAIPAQVFHPGQGRRPPDCLCRRWGHI